MIDEKTRAASKKKENADTFLFQIFQFKQQEALYFTKILQILYCTNRIITENRKCDKITLKLQKQVNFVIFHFFR